MIVFYVFSIIEKVNISHIVNCYPGDDDDDDDDDGILMMIEWHIFVLIYLTLNKYVQYIFMTSCKPLIM
ncbi:hypothetical protein DERP_014110 [Dermatophagoides pteronyssinus]|uniref:Uncharacterized protein n=1 Tax=Dermatophagoides pteronyssinus TaxID=6956 RepID=A0ABQ8IXM2_DERPT|nr:hypothetical protein DERP_014110 [Dermatophagoides pteronyssinus]